MKTINNSLNVYNFNIKILKLINSSRTVVVIKVWRIEQRHRQKTLLINKTTMVFSTIIVWPEAPYTVLAVGDEKTFGYHQNELMGQSILKLSGPQTDSLLFQRIVSSLQMSTMQLILYDGAGQILETSVSSRPLFLDGDLVGCLIILRPSSAVTLHQVFNEIRESRFPHCLVSAASPYRVQMAEDGFLSKFAFSREVVLGIDLPSLQESGAKSSNKLESMLAAASNGDVGRGRTTFQSAAHVSGVEEEVLCLPVVEGLNGPVHHVLVLLRPGPPGQRPSAPGLFGSPAPQDAAAAAAHDLAIRSRPRGGQGSGPWVMLTRARLEPLCELSLTEAARMVGVSNTAFKRGCRKLGLRRWPYRRARGRGAGSGRPGRPASDSGSACGGNNRPGSEE